MAKHVSHPGYDKTKFRVMRHDEYGKYGDLTKHWFTVDIFSKKWGMMKWRPLKHKEASWEEVYTVVTSFVTKDEAEAVIRKLEAAEHVNKTVSYEV